VAGWRDSIVLCGGWQSVAHDDTFGSVTDTHRDITDHYGSGTVETDPNPLYAFFAARLKRLRTSKGWSQEALGKRMGYSGEMVGKVEGRTNDPSPKFADALDLVFPELGGMFAALVEQAEDWQFQQWVDAEQSATVIHWWQPLSVPGLLQTEPYIRAVHEVWQAVDGVAAIDADVAARLERQSILERPLPPSLQVMLDESVLYRNIGGAKVMHDQLLHLAEMSERPRVSIQIVPADAGAHVGLLGAFAIASFADDQPDTIYMESPDRGTTTRNPRRTGRITVTFDVLRADALSARASRDRIREVAKDKWSND
jgi:DNA-binding XRE family transcriptional regulator